MVTVCFSAVPVFEVILIVSLSEVVASVTESLGPNVNMFAVTVSSPTPPANVSVPVVIEKVLAVAKAVTRAASAVVFTVVAAVVAVAAAATAVAAAVTAVAAVVLSTVFSVVAADAVV